MNNFIERQSGEFFKVNLLDIYMAGHNGFIAGGCFKNIFNNEKIKDVDIFFENEKDFNEAVNYYQDNEEEYVFSYRNKNTEAYKNKKTNIRVELVRSEFGSPEEILSKFDFSITKFAYFKSKELEEDELGLTGERIHYKILHHDLFFEHLHTKKLVLEPDILFPVSTFERSYRYTRYGYGLCKESKGNLINALTDADVKDLSNELYFGLD